MVLDKVIAALCEQLDMEKENITADTKLSEELSLDSIDKAELVTTLEDEFDIVVDYETALTVSTVGDIAVQIEKAMK